MLERTPRAEIKKVEEKSGEPEITSMGGKIEGRFMEGWSFKKDPLTEAFTENIEKTERKVKEMRESEQIVQEAQATTNAQIEKNIELEKLAKLEQIATKEFTAYEEEKQQKAFEIQQTSALDAKVKEYGKDGRLSVSNSPSKQKSFWGRLGSAATSTLQAFGVLARVSSAEPEIQPQNKLPELTKADEGTQETVQEIGTWIGDYLSEKPAVPAEITPGEFEQATLWDTPWVVEGGKPWGSHEIANRLASAGLIDTSMDRGEIRRIIYTYVDAFNKLGKKELVARGVQSGDFNKLQPGWQIDLSPLKNVILYKTN